MSHPWMPLYVADYLADTMHLSAAEHGAYMLLIMSYWQQGKLPTEDLKLARICRMTLPEWQEIRETISDLFGPDWTHKRIDDELAEAEQKIAKRKAAGRAGAEARYSNRIANAEQPQSQTHTPSQPPSPEEDKTSSLRSDVCPPAPEADEAKEAVEIYNAVASEAGWPRVQRLTPQRRAAVNARLRDGGGIAGWRAAIDKGKASSFLRGANRDGWKADFDFFCQSKSFTKLMEGSYDDRKPINGGKSGAGREHPHDALFRAIAEQTQAGNGADQWPSDPDAGIRDHPGGASGDRGNSLDLSPADYRRAS